MESRRQALDSPYLSKMSCQCEESQPWGPAPQWSWWATDWIWTPVISESSIKGKLSNEGIAKSWGIHSSGCFVFNSSKIFCHRVERSESIWTLPSSDLSVIHQTTAKTLPWSINLVNTLIIWSWVPSEGKRQELLGREVTTSSFLKKSIKLSIPPQCLTMF